MFEPKTIRVAVAYVVDDEQRLLLAWNDKWGAFTLPMSKMYFGPPAEKAEEAAIRAASEVLRLPTRAVAGKSAKETRALEVSARDGELKNYVYTVAPIELHPDFQGRSLSHLAVIWAPIARIESGEYRPLSETVSRLLLEIRQWGGL